ncbi:trimeric intracellular cation channel family protein [Salinibacillus aidingensis]|uniref:Trimeric intracellular cation channel family protein n=1 Tax=Salinibacillus aidingensis TaxID=237684 RepID=A0ABN1AM57_9BACI
MTWEIFNAIGTIAFAISGAIVALEEDYDILGVYVLGMVTAFGGGTTRNLLIGVPVSEIWDQGPLFMMAIFIITIVFLFPSGALKHWGRWGTFTDAIGLSTFAILGAMHATEMNHPLSAIIMAALLTGSGGGIIRDLLAGRKPSVLREDIYGAWAMLAGLLIGIDLVNQTWGLYLLFVAVVTLRMLTVKYGWKLPHRQFTDQKKAHM